jgi:hypothetical protein
MELTNNTLTACFPTLRITIIRACIKFFDMAQFMV